MSNPTKKGRAAGTRNAPGDNAPQQRNESVSTIQQDTTGDRPVTETAERFAMTAINTMLAAGRAQGLSDAEIAAHFSRAVNEVSRDIIAASEPTGLDVAVADVAARWLFRDSPAADLGPASPPVERALARLIDAGSVDRITAIVREELLREDGER